MYRSMDDKLLNIKHITIYSRKSRLIEGEDENETLEIHRKELIGFAERNNLKYELFEEVGSGDTIEQRPVFAELLKLIKAKAFDAVLVIHYDRLGRGNMRDQGTIMEIFKQSETLVIQLNPFKIINFDDEQDETLVELSGFLARQEYKAIKRRLKAGKVRGAISGKWINGKAPYGYKYCRETGKLIINEEEALIYIEIVNRFLNGEIGCDIAKSLNCRKIPSPKGCFWHENTIRRLLLNEVYIGKVLYGKTSGSGHKNRKTAPLKQKPRSEWIVIDKAHEPLITQKQRSQILDLFEKRKVTAKKSRKGSYKLSGLVYCGFCDKSMQFTINNNKDIFIRKCNKLDPYGNQCENPGVNIDVIFKILNDKLDEYKDELMRPNYDSQNELNQTKKMLSIKHDTLKKLNVALERVQELYEFGDIDRQEYLTRRDKRNNEILIVENEIENLKSSIEFYEGKSSNEKIELIDEFKKKIAEDNVDPKTINQLLKSLIRKIIYSRGNDNINIDIQFL